MYHVEYSVDAQKSMERLTKKDPESALRIYNWIGKNLEGCENPRRTGKPLVANFEGTWRYRVGDYRIIADIIDDRVLIQVMDIRARKTAYRAP